MATVKVSYDNLAEDAKVEVPYLGVFDNNSTTEVDSARWERFKRRNPQVEGDSIEFSTEQQKRDADAARKVSSLDASSAAELEDEHKKDELVEVAKALGIETSGKNKDQLSEEIMTKRSHESADKGFSSAADLNDQED